MKLIAGLSFALCFAPSSISGFGPLLRDPRSRTTVPTALSMSTEESVSVSANPVVKLAANGMSLLKPIFQLEAGLQAGILGAIGSVDKSSVSAEIEDNKKKNKVLIYTYGLSPFSTGALSVLDDSGYEYSKIELGAEWFLLGGEASETRVALSKEVDSGATSLPKIFIGGTCIGGYAELANIVDSGDLDDIMKKAGAKKKGAKKTSPFGMFSR